MRHFYFFPIFLMMYEFSAYMSNDMYIPAFPSIASDFGTGDWLVQFTLTAWLFGDAFSQLVLGPLSDKIGRRPVLLGGGVLFLLSCVGCLLAPNIYFMICARFIQGIAVCSMMVAGYTTIHESYKDEKAVSLLAMMSMVSVTAPMIGPLAGGYLLMSWDWRVIFLVILVPALLSLVGLFFFMPESNINRSTNAFNLRNLLREYGKVLKNFRFMTHALMFGLLYGGMMLWIATSPFLLMETNSLNTEQFGIAQLPVFASFMLGSQIVRFLVGKLRLESLMIGGIALAAIGAGIMVITGFYGDNMLYLIISSMSLYAMGFGLASAPLNRLSFNASHAEKGTVTSVFYTCMMSVGTIGTVIISMLYDGHLMSYAISLLITMLLAIILYSSYKHRARKLGMPRHY